MDMVKAETFTQNSANKHPFSGVSPQASIYHRILQNAVVRKRLSKHRKKIANSHIL